MDGGLGDCLASPRVRTSATFVLLVGVCVGCAEPTSVPGADLPEALDDRAAITPIERDLSLDASEVRLGARLFSDPALSHDGAVACVACHDLASGGDEGSVRSALPWRAPGVINVPSIFNLRYLEVFSWSGRWSSIDAQIDAAMRAPHSLATETSDAVERIRPSYAGDFEAVFPGTGLTEATFRAALAAYLYSLVTPDSAFDRYLSGDTSALSPEAADGFALFQDRGCISCHQGAGIGGNLYQRFGVMEDYFAGREPTRADLGRFAVTERERDRHVFRVPSLRNVELTAPYFHDGSAATLEDAVQVMARYQLGWRFSDVEIAHVVAFLRSLTGVPVEPS